MDLVDDGLHVRPRPLLDRVAHLLEEDGERDEAEDDREDGPLQHRVHRVHLRRKVPYCVQPLIQPSIQRPI